MTESRTQTIIETGLFGPLTVPLPADDAAQSAESAQALAELAAQAAVYATRARGAGTRRAYRSAWQLYCRWCAELGFPPLNGDAAIIGLYVAKAAERLAVATLQVHLAAIATAHRLAGLALDLKHPRIALVLEGVARSKGTRPRRLAAPLQWEGLRAMLAVQPESARGLRNRAMLLLGFGAALRRSELVALNGGDVREVAGRGLEILIRRSKTDPHGQGQEVAVSLADEAALCPVLALRAWRRCYPALQAEAPLFCAVRRNGVATGHRLSDKAVERLLKESAAAAGLPEPERYTGHALRAGLATLAAESQAQLHDIMRQTRHRSADMARRYLRSRDLWQNNVTVRLFRGAGGGGET